MKPILLAGIIIVNLALVSYSIAFVLLRRKKQLSKAVMAALLIGILFDVISTVCMIIGSGKIITVHGIIGYAALAGMVADTFVSWKVISAQGPGCTVSKGLYRWSAVAYGYWVFAYFTGAALIFIR